MSNLVSSLTNEAAVANQGGAMEADTISKNGRSSKSLMSRGKFLFMVVPAIMVSMLACSSPEADGKKVAKKFCDCDKNIQMKFLVFQQVL